MEKESVLEEPLQLIDFDNADQGGGIKINYNNLDRVLNRTEDRPLCIICICGPSRQGKSFMLGYMIRCLEALEKDEPDWMDWENKNKPLTGFTFRNGTAPETKGIWVWSKPFLCTVGPEDKNVAVILIDTQGTYDEFTSSRIMSSIVGLSLLISSCMIFNSFKQLQEDVLASLDSYIKYGMLAMENNQSSEPGSKKMKPFQNLTFLIRDWNTPGEYPYGSKGGKSFLEAKLQIKENQSPEARNIRETIKQCFESVDCFLMPNPGENALGPNFTGSIAELSVPFAKKLEDFISNRISPEDLHGAVKHIFGDEVTRAELKSLLETYVDIFNSAEMPTPMSILEACGKVVNKNAVAKSFKAYQDAMRKKQRSQNYLIGTALSKAHELAEKQAVSGFGKQRKCGDQDTILALVDELEEQISAEFKEIKRANMAKQEKYISNATKEAEQSFQEEMENEFPFNPENLLEFYEEMHISKNSSIAIQNLVDEFREKLGDDSEDKLDSFVSRLLENLGKLQEQILQTNKVRQGNAEKAMNTAIEEALSSYHLEMSKFASENPFESQQGFDNFHNKVKQRGLEEIGNTGKLHGGKHFHRNVLERLEVRLATAYDSEKQAYQFKIQEAHLKTKELIAELEEHYKTELYAYNNSSSPSLAELDSFRRENLQQQTCQFQSRALFPEATPEFSESLQALVEKLNSVYNALLHDIEEKQRESDVMIQEATEESFSFYHNEMVSLLKASKYLEEDQLDAKNSSLSREAIMLFEDRVKNNVTEKEVLVAKLVSDFENLKIQNEQAFNLAKAEAKNLVTDCHNEYQTAMKTAIDSVRSEEKLREVHDKACDDAMKNFRSRCAVKTEEFVTPRLNQLKQEIEDTFEEVLELFELKMGEEDGVTHEALGNARKFYNEEMQKNFENHDFIFPHVLQSLHGEITDKAIEKCCAQVPLTEAQKMELKEALQESFEKYKEENDMNLEVEDVAIGIDLGTTYSCVAVYHRGKVHIVRNVQGKNITPSYVAFNQDGSEMIGEPAKGRAYENPENTVFDAKRILGRKFTDEKLQKDIKLWAFTVEDDQGIPKINIRGKKMYPEEISARVLKELKRCAEQFLGCAVEKAVITVPAYFTDGQRQATIDAGKLADLEVLTILTEPVAAAIAYKKQHANEGGNRNVLIFDLGGGTFDVAILRTSHRSIDVAAVEGDDHLGGEDFDMNMMEYCVQEFKRLHGVDLFEGRDSTIRQTRDDVRRRLRRLQGECERKKIELTSARRVEVSVDSMHGRTDLNVVITREQFENLNGPLFNNTIEIVKKALISAKMEKSLVDDIVLVGGSTRIPKIQELLKSFFDGKALDCSINPDEAVAYGAAMKAAFMNGSIARESIDFTKIQDVIPMSLGVEIYGGGFSVIIPKSTKVPVRLQERYRTAHNNQTSVQITIYQGEESIAVRNRHLGDFYLNGIPPNDAEVENIDVEMEVNAQGILHVRAASTSTGGSNKITVTESKQRMSRAAINRILDEARAGAA